MSIDAPENGARPRAVTTTPLDSPAVSDAEASLGRNAKRPARLAEVIAGDLREQILSGDLADGDRLPPLDRLVEHYQVSPPSIREALRVLETEGLISVRLGKFGGATIHRPRAERAAYMLGLVLQAEHARVGDLAGAILELDAACVRTCARREDRATTVVPVLRACLARASDMEHPDNSLVGFVQFHQATTAECGNDTLVLVVGALMALWVSQNVPWPYRDLSDFDIESREEVLEAHRQLLRAIEDGDADEASRLLYGIVLDPDSPSGRRRNPVVKALPIGARRGPVPSGGDWVSGSFGP
jgi:GntR family transcriptional repressor for pyruvate dehydrogenase complex